jgi:hypothetical protein
LFETFFTQISSETFAVLAEVHVGLQVKWSLKLSDLNEKMKSEMPGQVFVKFSSIRFHENPSRVVLQLFHASNGLSKLNKRCSTDLQTPKNGAQIIISVCYRHILSTWMYLLKRSSE